MQDGSDLPLRRSFMSHWRRLSRKRRALHLALVVLALATAAWARRTPATQATATTGTSSPAANLKAPLPPPADVFIQKTSAFPQGNVLVMVQLTSQELAVKQADRKRAFITLGDLRHQVILRDDGQPGSSTVFHVVFSLGASMNEADLAAR